MRIHFKHRLVFVATMQLVGLFFIGCSDGAGGNACECDSAEDGSTDLWDREVGDTEQNASRHEDNIFDSLVVSNVSNEDVTSEYVHRDIVFAGDECDYANINTDDCEISCHEDDYLRCIIATQSDGTEVAVVFARRFKVAENIELELEGDRPLIILATDDVEIRGRIWCGDRIDNSNGMLGGFSGASYSGQISSPGYGPGAGGAGLEGVGGGGGGYCGAGGSGGATATYSTSPDNGGGTYGNSELVPLKGGSSGGSSEFNAGGAGGGALQITSATSIRVYELGYIAMSGNLGFDNEGGGGGSGGALLLEAPEVNIDGIIAANGGSGAGTAEDGSMGMIGDDPAPGGGCEDEYACGGDGSGGDLIDGNDGGAPENDFFDGGGGGGGAGWIRINTIDGTVDIAGVVSPSLNTGCFSIGTLPAQASNTEDSL